MSQNVAVIIQTCDKYKFLWKGWYYYFMKHWDFNIPANIFFCTEEKFPFMMDTRRPRVGWLTTGEGPWGERLIKILDTVSAYDIIFYMQEDFWLHRTLPKQVFESRLQTFREMDMNAYRCCEPSKHFHLEESQQAPYRFQDTSPYLMTHQASFWKKDFLRSCILPHEDPWQNEKRGTERIKDSIFGSDDGDLGDHKIYFAPFRFYYTVCQKGKLTEQGEQLNAAI